jgi:hypothetical protein
MAGVVSLIMDISSVIAKRFLVGLRLVAFHLLKRHRSRILPGFRLKIRQKKCQAVASVHNYDSLSLNPFIIAYISSLWQRAKLCRLANLAKIVGLIVSFGDGGRRS